jgi:hypothetical protein
LSAADWLNPTLIFNATTPAAPAGASATLAGNTLTVNAPAVTGTFRVFVTATDGISTAIQTFLVNVTTGAPGDQTPVVSPIPDQTVGSNSAPVNIPLTANDPDGDPVQLTAVVSPAGPAADLQRQLGLYFKGSYYQGFDGLNEKWLWSATQNQWYVILPDGEVRPGKTVTDKTTDVATLDASYWQDPSLIFAPPTPSLTASIVGTTLTLTPPANFSGTYRVTVTATDGRLAASQSFLVFGPVAEVKTIPGLPAVTSAFVPNPQILVDFLAFTAPGFTPAGLRTFFPRDSTWSSGVSGVAFGSRDASGNLQIIVGSGPGQFSQVREFTTVATPGFTSLPTILIFSPTSLFFGNLFATPLSTQFGYNVASFGAG